MKVQKAEAVYIENAQDKGVRLARIHPAAKDKWTEGWLQELIFNHPELLPVSEFDLDCEEVIPLAREVQVTLGERNGSIDNLYVTKKGRLVIVETKLWKNPEAHREVVAQVMQYAKSVSALKFNAFEDAIARARGESVGAFRRLMEPHLLRWEKTFDEFQEEFLKLLKAGNFLLLIVGDRISPNVVFLGGEVHNAPGMLFSLGLVELRIYAIKENRDWPLVIVPDVVGRTIEETRAVIRIERNDAEPEIIVPDEVHEKAARGSVTEETLAATLPEGFKSAFEELTTDWLEKGRTLSFGTVGIVYYAIPKGKEKSINVFEVYPTTTTCLTAKWALKKGLTDTQFAKYKDALTHAPHILNACQAGKPWIRHKRITSQEFELLLQANVMAGDMLVDGTVEDAGATTR